MIQTIHMPQRRSRNLSLPARVDRKIVVVARIRPIAMAQKAWLAFWLACASLQISAAEPEPLDPLAEFTAVGLALHESEFPYQGQGRLKNLEQELTQPLSYGREVDVLISLAEERLHHGDIRGAIDLYGTAIGKVQIDLGLGADVEPVLVNLYRDRALAWLQLGEEVNCESHRTAASCIYPITESGVHRQREYAERSLEDLLEVLSWTSRDPEARWLANVVTMVLGEHPARLPTRHRIPAMQGTGAIPRFRDVATDVAVAGFDLAGGVMVEDFDGDHDLDIVTTTSDVLGTMTYYERASGGFRDKTADARLDQQLGGLNGIAADYDGDGDVDLFVLRGGWMRDFGRIRNSLLENDGHGTFADVTAKVGLDSAYPTQAAVWLDVDNDGDLDLYVANEDRGDVEHPSNLFLNEANRFVDAAQEYGVTNDRFAKGVTAGDYDNDGDMDFFVSNIGANRLYQNQGDGSFKDVAPSLGLTEPLISFAPWFFDVNNDGWLDLFVGAYDAELDDVARDHLGETFSASAPALFQNNGDGTFTNVAEAMGLNHAYMPMGANFGDLDNDGWLDMYLGTGRPGLKNLVPNVMLRNVDGVRFEDVTVDGGFGHLQKGHGIAFNDLDHDGDQDVYHQLGGFYPVDRFFNALFENPAPTSAFLKIKLQGIQSNRLGVGARIQVEVDTARGRHSLHRAVGSVSSFGGSSLARQEIGLRNATAIRRVVVHWPASGITNQYENVPLNAYIEITEGAETFRQLPHSPLPFAPSPDEQPAAGNEHVGHTKASR
jgi:hypothetical protein